MSAKIRKLAVTVEETRREMGREIAPPTRKAVAVAVIENPFAGRYEEDLSELMEIGAELGGLLGERCVSALGIAPNEAESYGKSAMVGENGELGTCRRDPAPEAGCAAARGGGGGRGVGAVVEEDGQPGSGA